MCLSIDLWNLILEHPKMAYFRPFLPFWAKKAIFPSFEEISSRNIFSSTSRMKTIKVWKVFKNFQTFRKFWKKKAFGTSITPKPTNEIFGKFQNFKIFICGFGVLGCLRPFFQNFRKVWKFLNSFHTLNVFIRQVLPAIIGPQIWSKWVAKWWKRGGNGENTANSPIFSIFEVQISLWVRIVWKRPRYEKFFKILGLFKNFQKKGFWHPQHPKTCNQNFEKSENLILGLGGGDGASDSPKIKIFEKFYFFRIFFIP